MYIYIAMNPLRKKGLVREMCKNEKDGGGGRWEKGGGAGEMGGWEEEGKEEKGLSGKWIKRKERPVTVHPTIHHHDGHDIRVIQNKSYMGLYMYICVCVSVCYTNAMQCTIGFIRYCLAASWYYCKALAIRLYICCS